MASGVKVPEEVKHLCSEMIVPPSKASRARLAIFKIEDGHVIVNKVIRQPDLDGRDPYTLMKELLENQDCCYLLYDCHYRIEDGYKEELVFMMWCDENAHVKQKMLYASSSDYMKKALQGVKHVFQVNCISEVNCRKEFACRLASTVVSLEGVEL